MATVKPTAKHVLLRDMDTKLWRNAKSRAAKEGFTLKALITKLLSAYVTHGLPRESRRKV